MSYKTILVHLADERRLSGLLAPAVGLARRFEAHLKGLAVLPPPIIEPSLTPGGAGTVVIESCRKAFAEEAARMQALFETAARDAGLRSEWVLDDAQPWPAGRKVAEHARVADLVVTAQADPEWAVATMTDGPEALVLSCGRPVLIIPSRGDHVDAGRRVVVAWNGRREAARAAFDALPLLQKAESVRVLWIRPDDSGEAGDVPASDLATALARHGVRCEAAETARLETGVGETLLASLRDARADLLVMGCYGHSRFRELILGGATRHVLRAMTVPALMSH
jgi:nucleotide-binding universal stress UspA family protein